MANPVAQPKLSLPNPQYYRRRLEVADYWFLSKSIRRNLLTPEYVDTLIVQRKQKQNCSVWFTDMLDSLQELNKLRYSNGKEETQ